MALAPPLITTPSASVTGCARRIEAGSGNTVLVLDDGRRVVVASQPDTSGARRSRRALNRVTSVRIDGTGEACTAEVRGLGNRLPITLTVSTGTALALIDEGVPAIIRIRSGVVR